MSPATFIQDNPKLVSHLEKTTATRWRETKLLTPCGSQPQGREFRAQSKIVEI